MGEPYAIRFRSYGMCERSNVIGSLISMGVGINRGSQLQRGGVMLGGRALAMTDR
jgi:hypothetical protein